MDPPSGALPGVAPASALPPDGLRDVTSAAMTAVEGGGVMHLALVCGGHCPARIQMSQPASAVTWRW
jgi:hypothetical protein